MAAGSLVVADVWAGIRICTINLLGDEFLETVQQEDTTEIHKLSKIITQIGMEKISVYKEDKQ